MTAALELVERGAVHAERTQRRDLVAHALGLEGSIRAKLGQLDDGVRLARDGLSIALTESLTEAATELYLRLAAVLENAADLGGAERLYGEAHDFCVANASPEAAQVCLVCLAYSCRCRGRAAVSTCASAARPRRARRQRTRVLATSRLQASCA